MECEEIFERDSRQDRLSLTSSAFSKSGGGEKKSKRKLTTAGVVLNVGLQLHSLPVSLNKQDKSSH